jgi:serine/threonine-protein kinase
VGDEFVIGGQLGSYLIESVVGRGGMSVVYRAKHARLSTSVALKVLAPELSSDDNFRERFLREAQMAAAIDHPNVVPIYDMGMHEGSLYIVMRYVSGGDLKALLATTGPLDAEQALALLRPIALALDAAHAHELVHRDVKPGNILIQRALGGEIEHVYLTDFGIAKSSSISGLTRAGGLIGTVEYMAPEQVGGGKVSAQTDVYALAGVFYECLTGEVPFERELAQGALPPAGPVQPVTAVRPELPSALDGVLVKALSRDSAERYATCEQFLHACGYVLESRTSGAERLAGATAAEAAPRAGETAEATPGRWAATAAPRDEPARTRGGSDAWASAAAPAPPPPPPIQQHAPPPASRPPRRDGSGSRFGGRRWYGAVAAALVVAAVAVVLLTKSSSTSTTKSAAVPAAVLAQVPTNHVTGSGNASVKLKGDVATVTLTTNGLDYNESLGHALHIHGGGKGLCPPASAARAHNGHLTISTTDGINYYGAPVQALTTSGDTGTASILAFSRYPTGGTIRYTRTINLPPPVAAYIRQNNAVIVVHGVDYDHSGIYSGVLDRSELNKSVPGTATAPALCGVLTGPRTVAGAASGTSARTVDYTASLVETVAQAVPASELFGCVAPEAAPAAPGERRRSSAALTAVASATVG